MTNIGSLFNKIGDAFEKIKDIEKGFKKIEKGLNKTGDVIEDTANYVFVEQIGGFFKKFIKSIDYAIVQPLEVFFIGIGDIFLGIFGILWKIIEKIISIPKCMFWYLLDGAIQITKLFIPKWAMSIFNTVYAYILIPLYYIFLFPVIWVFDLILWVFGFKSIFSMFSDGGCLSFNLAPQVGKMNKALISISKVFSKQFGRFDKGF